MAPRFQSNCFFLSVEVSAERLKIRREEQEAKKRTAEGKKEAEGGSVNTTELPTQKIKAEDGETTVDTSSQGKKKIEYAQLVYVFQTCFECICVDMTCTTAATAQPPAEERCVSDSAASQDAAAPNTESLEPNNETAQSENHEKGDSTQLATQGRTGTPSHRPWVILGPKVKLSCPVQGFPQKTC